MLCGVWVMCVWLQDLYHIQVCVCDKDIQDLDNLLIAIDPLLPPPPHLLGHRGGGGEGEGM
jgi:hypothetical protein